MAETPTQSRDGIFARLKAAVWSGESVAPQLRQALPDAAVDVAPPSAPATISDLEAVTLIEATPRTAAATQAATMPPAVAPADAPQSLNLSVAAAKPEAVRLVIWDLDETFWRGTLTEGGIGEYVQAHHEIILELARRGIMSSICSKNDYDTVVAILEEKGLMPYIIFPSISWEPKGWRLARLIETVGLRPATVMFLDDNPNNLAEARAMVEGIQVESEAFIAHLLGDPRFVGKNDAALSRLAQYKVLEQRRRDEHAAETTGGDNHEFLRGCDVRVYIEHDVEKHIDRVVELINRTNQLNYTKKRLPEDAARARAMILEQSRQANHQVGLVRVVDKYGDYGFVGFYMLRNRRSHALPGLANQTLVHYCWSCRTLGMLVEQWFYEQLRQPELAVVGEVLTDLAVPRNIDWIRRVQSIEAGAAAQSLLAPEIRLLGGCEANAVGHFLGSHAEKVRIIGNFAAGGLFVRVNSVSLLLSAIKHAGPAFEAEMRTLGISAGLLGGDFFDDAAPGTVFIFSGAYDGAPANRHRYKNLEHGWEIKVGLRTDWLDLVHASEAQIDALETDDNDQSIAMASARHIRAHYGAVRAPTGGVLKSKMLELVARLPRGCKLVVLQDDPRGRNAKGTLTYSKEMETYNSQVAKIVAPYPFIAALSFGDFIESEDEIQGGGNHYDRKVYWRAAERIVTVAQDLQAKRGPHLAGPTGIRAPRVPAGAAIGQAG